MQRYDVGRPLGVALMVAVVVLGVAACGNTAEVEPTEPPRPSATPTTEVFESPLVPSATPAPLVPEGDNGGARGTIVAAPPDWADLQLTVFFAPFTGDIEGEGIFVLEPSFHPSTEVGADGRFELGNIPPGPYVVVIGPTPEQALAIREGERPVIYEIVAGEILDLGDISLER